MKRILLLSILLSLFVFLASCANTESPPSAATNETTPTEQPAANTEELSSNNNEPEKADTKSESTQSVPKFEDYPAGEAFTGKTAPLIFTVETKVFRTKLEEAAKGSPNYGGQYIVATWGCGTDCVMGGVIDAKTGSTAAIPFSICCLDVDSDKDKIEFKKDSSLIIFNGLLNEKESEIKTHYYQFENGKFVKISKDK